MPRMPTLSPNRLHMPHRLRNILLPQHPGIQRQAHQQSLAEQDAVHAPSRIKLSESYVRQGTAHLTGRTHGHRSRPQCPRRGALIIYCMYTPVVLTPCSEAIPESLANLHLARRSLPLPIATPRCSLDDIGKYRYPFELMKQSPTILAIAMRTADLVIPRNGISSSAPCHLLQMAARSSFVHQ